jgi:hypothetical protein
MSERALLASINGEPVGTLQDVNGIWAFRYTDAWLNNPHRFALSPHLGSASMSLMPASCSDLIQGKGSIPESAIEPEFAGTLPPVKQLGKFLIRCSPYMGFLLFSASIFDCLWRLVRVEENFADTGFHPTTISAVMSVCL